MFFWAIFICRSSQAAIIKLKWWVETIFWKNPEKRGELTLIEPLKYHIAKNGRTIVKLFLCRSMDGILHLLRHFRWVLTSKKSSEHRKFGSRCGWLDTSKKSLNWRWAELHAAKMVELPRIPIGPKQGYWCMKLVLFLKWFNISQLQLKEGLLQISTNYLH